MSRAGIRVSPRDHPAGHGLPRVRMLLLLLLVTVAWLTACTSTASSGTGRSSDPPGRTSDPLSGGSTGSGALTGALTGSITVSAASSLTAPITKIAADFRAANPGIVDVALNFESSSTLVKQIQEGAPVDVFASADDINMAKLANTEQLVGAPVSFARNRLTIVVKKGNPEKLVSLADLGRAGVVSLCGEEVPCGRYAEQMLAAAGVEIPTNRITRGQNAKATLRAVAEGDADAGIVYVTDVTDVSGDLVESVVIADAQNVVGSYPIAVVRGTGNQAAAEAFVAFVRSPSAQATLTSARFLAPA